MNRLTSDAGHLTQVLDAVANGITIQDTSGRLVFVNQAAARMMGFASGDDAIAKGGAGILAEFEYYDEHGRPMKPDEFPGRLALQGQAEPKKIVGHRRRGSHKTLSWTAVKALPVKDEAGHVVLSVNVLEDITAQKYVESQLKEANARITKLLEQTLATS